MALAFPRPMPPSGRIEKLDSLESLAVATPTTTTHTRVARGQVVGEVEIVWPNGEVTRHKQPRPQEGSPRTTCSHSGSLYDPRTGKTVVYNVLPCLTWTCDPCVVNHLIPRIRERMNVLLGKSADLYDGREVVHRLESSADWTKLQQRARRSLRVRTYVRLRTPEGVVMYTLIPFLDSVELQGEAARRSIIGDIDRMPRTRNTCAASHDMPRLFRWNSGKILAGKLAESDRPTAPAVKTST